MCSNKIVVLKKIITVFILNTSIFLIAGCSSDNPEEDVVKKENETPILTLEQPVINTDNKTVTLVFSATDTDGSITNKTAKAYNETNSLVSNGSISKQEYKYIAKFTLDLSIKNITVTITDNKGATTNKTTSIDASKTNLSPTIDELTATVDVKTITITTLASDPNGTSDIKEQTVTVTSPSNQVTTHTPDTNGKVILNNVEYGTYNMVFTVTDQKGESDSKPLSINVNNEAPTLENPTETVNTTTGVVTASIEAKDADGIASVNLEIKDASENVVETAQMTKNGDVYTYAKALDNGIYTFTYTAIDNAGAETISGNNTVEVEKDRLEVIPDNYSAETKEILSHTTNLQYTNLSKSGGTEETELFATTSTFLLPDGTEAKLITEFVGEEHESESKTQIAKEVIDNGDGTYTIEYEYLADVVAHIANLTPTKIATSDVENLSNSIAQGGVVREFMPIKGGWSFENMAGDDVDEAALQKALEHIVNTFGTTVEEFTGNSKGNTEFHQAYRDTKSSKYMLELNMMLPNISQAQKVYIASALTARKVELQTPEQNTNEIQRVSTQWIMENFW